MTTPSALTVLALVLGLAAAAHAGEVPPLESLRWKKRLILLFAPKADDASLVQQRNLFQAWKREMDERDVVVFEVTDAVSNARELRLAHGVSDAMFATVLVGKDGGVKLRSTEPMAWKRLRQEIDAMPMRRREAGREP